MNTLGFIYGLREDFSYQLYNWVGVPNARSAELNAPLLPNPVPAPTDADSVWVAPNGNDGNPGTQAQPKKTIKAAIAALGGGRTNINIFRNGYVGELVFEEEFSSFLNDNNIGFGRSIQTDSSTEAATIMLKQGIPSPPIATLIFRDTSIGSRLKIIGRTQLESTAQLWQCELFQNGTPPTPAATPHICLVVYTAFNSPPNPHLHLKNCILSILNRNFGHENIGTAGETFTQSLIQVTHSSAGFATNRTFGFENCIFYTDTGIPRCIQFEGATTVFVPNETSYVYGNRSIFIGGDYGVYHYVLSNLNIPVSAVELHNCAFINNKMVMRPYTSGSNLVNFTGTINYCIRNGVGLYDFDQFNNRPQDAGIIILDQNGIPDGTPPLYIDQQRGMDQTDPYGFSLQIRGKPAPAPLGTRTYYLNSQLYFAGKDPATSLPVNISPFTEEVDFYQLTFHKQVELEYPPSSLTMSIELANYTSQIDVRGNYHATYSGDGITFTFRFGSGNSFATLRDWQKLIDIFTDRGVMQFFPKGLQGDLFTDPCTGALAAEEVNWTPPTMAVSPIIISGPSMLNNVWKHAIISIFYIAEWRDFFIDGNDGSNIYIVNKFNHPLPPAGPGVFPFRIQKYLVRPTIESLQRVQDLATQFQMGGGFREPSEGERLPYPPRDFELQLRTVEDLAIDL